MLNIAVVGYGQISKMQHVPVLRESSAYNLVGIVDPQVECAEGLPVFPNLQALLDSGIKCDSLAICTPPSVRYEVALEATRKGLHILLEKPPVLALSELLALKDAAQSAGTTLFTAWHSRYARCAKEAARLLSGQAVEKIDVCWMEDHEKWHPGAAWLWKAGGFGAFDAGVNALSLLQSVMDVPLVYQQAKLEFADGAQTPIRADVQMSAGAAKIPVRAWFDIGYKGDGETWTITWTLNDGRVVVASEGGAELSVDGQKLEFSPQGAGDPHWEYRSLYNVFAELTLAQKSEIYTDAYVIATDCMAHGQRLTGKLRRPD